ncbi:hypothetical protein G7Y89_g12459 [Cudoniella acicularis]|uniref:Heterokaryon incompatibility domain-containing protein n=1 Tax=Cudoniella acicularis TaxID=354080 RepID=A0A8H4RBH3_9HELO|nr:hypothetical protein G7Y89_g12459 [Cudoniella acicularis]
MNEPPISADGLNKLYDAGEDANVDIVFVHGLMGHPRDTWEAVNPSDPSEMIYWPKELLPITVPESRVFAFGYPTGFATFYPIITDPIAHMTIDNDSTSLIVKLGTIRRETHTESRPIFFITHSLGGLVCANVLSSHHGSDAQSQGVVNHTRGVIFLGTPFQGSSKVTWAKMAEKFLGLFSNSNNQTINDLDKDSSKLKQISTDFHMFLRERYASRHPKPIQVACFYETMSTTKKLGPLRKDLGQIVTAESATLTRYKAIPINANHCAMCKFPDNETTGYIDVTGMLKVMISNLDKDVNVEDFYDSSPHNVRNLRSMEFESISNCSSFSGRIVRAPSHHFSQTTPSRETTPPDDSSLEGFDEVNPPQVVPSTTTADPAPVSRDNFDNGPQSTTKTGPPSWNTEKAVRQLASRTKASSRNSVHYSHNNLPRSNSHPYNTLPFKDSLRLLEIQPGTRNTPIAARIHLTRIGEQPTYEALSYVWGHEKLHDPKPIVTLDEKEVEVTPNLFHALERIRLQDRSKLIWVDMLCINQSDDTEKGQQVQLMSRIYKMASRVLVWLGRDDTGTSKEAFTLVCEAVNYYSQSAKANFTSSGHTFTVTTPETFPDVDSPRWGSLERLFDLDWFWRVWVIQEIALSVAASLMWGDSEIEWAWVGLAAAYIRINLYGIFEHYFMPGIFNVYFMYRISIAADTVVEPASLSFLRLLAMTQQYGASNDRDRVYGLLGLPSTNSNPDGSPFIVPYYKLCVPHVYKEVALKIIEAERGLSLFSSVQHDLGQHDPSQHDPSCCSDSSQGSWSWVPMWNKVFTKSLLSGDDTQCHKADGGIPRDLTVLDDCLMVRGLDAGRVIEILQVMKDTDFRVIRNHSANNSAWQYNDQVLHTLLHASEDKTLLPWTLSAGKNWYGLLVEDEETHLADFVAWLVARLDLSISGTSLESKVEIDSNKNQRDDFLSCPPAISKYAAFLTKSGNPGPSVDKQTHVLDPALRSLAERGDAERFAEAAKSASTGRRLFFAEDGRLGLGPAAVEKGDRLCILFGGTVPFILRPEGQYWRLIGECYMKTVMNGEGVEKYKDGKVEAMIFVIR